MERACEFKKFQTNQTWNGSLVKNDEWIEQLLTLAFAFRYQIHYAFWHVDSRLWFMRKFLPFFFLSTSKAKRQAGLIGTCTISLKYVYNACWIWMRNVNKCFMWRRRLVFGSTLIDDLILFSFFTLIHPCFDEAQTQSERNVNFMIERLISRRNSLRGN